ncbi:MAG: hypothetical protein ACRELF_17125, partial [Gemmataceae bacterium]
MLRSLLTSLLKDLLVAVALLAASAILPFASFWLCRSEIGGQIVFWAGPWTCAVWVLLVSVLVGSRSWHGRGRVLAWRAARGGYVASSLRATAMMFLGLFASYAAEIAVVLLVPPSPTAMHLVPLATYSPVALAVLWSAARG